MGASVFVAKRGGMIITCAATTGFMIEYDNRYLWMNLKTLKGCHFANYREAWEANRLIAEGKIHPTLSKVFPLEDTGEAAYQVHHNQHEGKLGVLCLAPEEGLGVTDGEMRERLLAADHALPQVRLTGRSEHDDERAAPRSTTSPSRSTTSRPRSSTTEETFGCEVEHREVVERDGVEEALLKVADSYVQLLTPTRDDSPVAKYLEKKGEGLHHIGYRVADCARGARAGEGRQGHRVIDEAPAPGQPRHDRRVRPPEDRVRHAHRARPGELALDRAGRGDSSASRAAPLLPG